MKRIVTAAAALMFTPFLALAAEPSSTAAAPPAATAAPADATPDAEARRGQRWAACATEVQKFCTGIEKGKGKMRACLDGHTAELSDGCKARMAEKRPAGAM